MSKSRKKYSQSNLVLSFTLRTLCADKARSTLILYYQPLIASSISFFDPFSCFCYNHTQWARITTTWTTCAENWRADKARPTLTFYVLCKRLMISKRGRLTDIVSEVAKLKKWGGKFVRWEKEKWRKEKRGGGKATGKWKEEGKEKGYRNLELWNEKWGKGKKRGRRVRRVKGMNGGWWE